MNQPYFNEILRLKSWDFAFMSGLANMSGTWDLELGTPCKPAPILHQQILQAFISIRSDNLQHRKWLTVFLLKQQTNDIHNRFRGVLYKEMFRTLINLTFLDKQREGDTS